MSLKLDIDRQAAKKKFSSLENRADIAELLDVTEKQLKYYLYVESDFKNYRDITIPKRNGSVRRISIPISPLKIIQQKLNQILQCVYKPKATVHGFVKGKNILTNAEMHAGQRYVLNIDLKDFFPSINFGRVRGLFMAVPYGLNSTVATTLAQICCYDDQLPQGAPTSPTIANMICAKMDSQLLRLAVKNRCLYTRYADDLSFSTSLRVFPGRLATIADTEEGRIVGLGTELRETITNNGFEINDRKVRLQTRNYRQEVTGLVVNTKSVNVRRKFIRQVRAMLHAWEKYGLEQAEEEHFLKYRHRYLPPFKKRPSFDRIVKGKIEYIGMIRGKDDLLYLHYLKQLKTLAPQLVKATFAEVDDEIDRSKLKRNIVGAFSLNELHDLCFELRIDHEELGGEGKTNQVNELIKFTERHGRYEELVKKVNELRPKRIDKDKS